MLDINWSGIIDPIYELFAGNTTKGLNGIFNGNELLLGVFILLLFFVLTLLFGLGILIGIVVLLPSLFAVFGYIPNLRIIIAIICGLIFGLGLHRLVRR